MKGIYKYTDLKTGDVVYIGKDSHIDKNLRHKNHLSPSYYDRQPFNRVLQNNIDRYEYSVLYSSDNVRDDDLNILEMSFIERYNPKFNFTKGGEGSLGYIHTNEAKQKMSKAKTRDDLDDNVLAKEYFDNGLTTHEIADKYNTTHQTVSRRLKKNGYQLRDYSEYYNTSGYFCVIKQKSKTCKQGFTWCYQYIENGKRKKISSVDIKTLEEKVKAKGLEWRKL